MVDLDLVAGFLVGALVVFLTAASLTPAALAI